MGVLTADVGFSLEDLSVVEVDGLALQLLLWILLSCKAQMWSLGIGIQILQV